MRIPHSDLKSARDHARIKAEETGHCWYVNRLASSGMMRYEVSDKPITDTSFGGGLVSVIHPTNDDCWKRVYGYLGQQLFQECFRHRTEDPIIQNLLASMLLIARQNEVSK